MQLKFFVIANAQHTFLVYAVIFLVGLLLGAFAASYDYYTKPTTDIVPWGPHGCLQVAKLNDAYVGKALHRMWPLLATNPVVTAKQIKDRHCLVCLDRMCFVNPAINVAENWTARLEKQKTVYRPQTIHVLFNDTKTMWLHASSAMYMHMAITHLANYFIAPQVQFLALAISSSIRAVKTSICCCISRRDVCSSCCQPSSIS